MGYKYKIGDKVKLKSCSGFVSNSDTLNVIIPDVEENREAIVGMDEPCFFCDNPECLSWPTLYGTDDKGETVMLCHVSECQIL